MRPRALDALAVAGTLAFLLFAMLLNHGMWADAGGVNESEFFVYAAAAAIALWAIWLALRRHPWPPWEIALLAFALVLHFAGGLVILEGRRVYDHVILGMRFDKPVHFINAAIAARVAADALYFERVSLGRLHRLVVILIVLGIGATVEIMEYLVVRSIPDTGVGLYDNNMQDLIANLGGAVVSTLLFPARRFPQTGATTGHTAAP